MRRVVCDHCERLYEPSGVVEVRERRRLPSLPVPSLPSVALPTGLDLRWLTLPVAALAVFAVLSLVNSGEAEPPSAEPAAATDAAAPLSANRDPKDAKSERDSKPAPVPSDAQLVSESTFSLALPPGWDRVNPAAGATFAAVSEDGTADATLWIQNDPKLDLATFEARSLEQLEALAGSAEVVERKVGPTVESSSIVLAPKGAPAGAPAYEVVLRGAGGNWYYLATTYQASASAETVGGVDLIQGSFVPHGGKG